MPFQARNPFYLRISERNVLPLYLYLDERHLDWMNDLVLQHVLADLRPQYAGFNGVPTSLVAGSTTKKATVATHRGETYQFCYFFRKTEPHSVVIKTRTFIAVPPKRAAMPPPPVPSSSKLQRGKRKPKAVVETGINDAARKRRKTKGKDRALDEQDELLVSSTDDDRDDDFNPGNLRRSRQAANSPAGGYQELDEGEADTPGPVLDIPSNMEVDASHKLPSRMAMELQIEEEEKPKPLLQLNYQGFSIYGHCLCIVVEPWPLIRSTSRAPSVPSVSAPSTKPNIAPHLTTPNPEANVRAQTPLFLPDDYRERSETPAPLRSFTPAQRTSSLLDPSFLDDSDDSGDEGGMMLFSQLLNSTGDVRAGAADDDEDMDTDMFFGDADEVREL